jgi:ABC-2 type transport system ATP-binding protein
VASSLEKRFGAHVAVRNVSLALHPGEVVALLGPNGAGKTTTLRLLAGILPPSRGTVTIGGIPQTPGTWPATRGRIGFLTETPGLWDRLDVEANLLTYARLYGVKDPRARVAHLLGRLALADRAADPAATLSKGMRQKVALARALLHDPTVVLLDEPTAGLDPGMSRTVRDLVAELRADGRAVLLSTHNLAEAERLADRVAVMKQTLVAVGTPAELRAGQTPRRIVVTLASPAAALVPAILRAGARDAVADGVLLRCSLDDVARDTPRLVRALVEAGAEIRAVVPDQAPLEDIYLALVGSLPPPERPGATDEVG